MSRTGRYLKRFHLRGNKRRRLRRKAWLERQRIRRFKNPRIAYYLPPSMRAIARHYNEHTAHSVTARKGAIDIVLPVMLDFEDNYEQTASHFGMVRSASINMILDGFEDMSHDRFQSTDGGHGRIETRKIWVSDEVHWLGEILQERPGLTAVAAVEPKRQLIGGKTSVERRYFITNRSNANAQWIAQTVRGHRAVENQLHWQLDVSFDEDQRRIRKNYGAENYSRLCRIALNLLKRDKSAKIGFHGNV